VYIVELISFELIGRAGYVMCHLGGWYLWCLYFHGKLCGSFYSDTSIWIET